MGKISVLREAGVPSAIFIGVLENIRSFPSEVVQSIVSGKSLLGGLSTIHILQRTFGFHGGRNLSAITTLVQIADRFGHTSAMMTRDETLEAVADNEGAWVFNGNGQMVQPAELAEANWDTIGTVRIVPGLVGGL